jgi:hypothetical protein
VEPWDLAEPIYTLVKGACVLAMPHGAVVRGLVDTGMQTPFCQTMHLQSELLLLKEPSPGLLVGVCVGVCV